MIGVEKWSDFTLSVLNFTYCCLWGPAIAVYKIQAPNYIYRHIKLSQNHTEKYKNPHIQIIANKIENIKYKLELIFKNIMPQVRIKLTTSRLGDWRAPNCATKGHVLIALINPYNKNTASNRVQFHRFNFAIHGLKLVVFEGFLKISGEKSMFLRPKMKWMLFFNKPYQKAKIVIAKFYLVVWCLGEHKHAGAESLVIITSFWKGKNWLH